MSDRPEIRIRLQANQPSKRVNEPITCGVPFPKGCLNSIQDLRIFDATGRSIPLQTNVLDRWSDGSPRWLLCDWQATTGAGEYVLRCVPDSAEAPAHHIVSLLESDKEAIHLDTDAISLFFEQGTPLFLAGGIRPGQHHIRADLLIEDATHHGVTSLEQHELSTFGPVRSSVTFHGESRLPGFLSEEIFVEVTCFAGLSTVRCRLIIGNAKPAEHPGGLWDLGNAGSKLLKEAKFRFALDRSAAPGKAHCSTSLELAFEPLRFPFELYQDSSGGENWQSGNHINCNRIVPNRIPGYRLRSGDVEKTGLRATPIVTLDRGDQHLAVSMPSFWQNFPNALEADEESITLSLFPRQYDDLHELQGGEQKTHVFYVSFGRDLVTEEPLAWTRDPLIPVVDPEWVASTGAVPYLTPGVRDPHAGYLQLVDAAIAGDDTFEKKRETIDEYGWRHFGDIFGDHEAVFHKSPAPLISHYNNQYDAVAGLTYQFLRSGDVRWKKLADELAAHVIDIDIYHTDQDKAAYNHGLFWHTYHYVDADTGTHRSYPKNGRIPPDGKPVPGGGQPTSKTIRPA